MRSPGIGVQRQQRIGKQVVAHPVGAIEIGRRRARRHVHDAALLRPPPCPPSCSPSRCTSTRPSATSRNRTRPDAESCGSSSASSRSARRRREYRPATRAAPRTAPADDQQVLINDPRTWSAPPIAAPARAPNPHADRSARRFRSPGSALPVAHPARRRSCPPRQRSAGRALRPIGHAAIRAAHIEPGIELPQQFPAGRIERDDPALRRVGIQHPADDDRAGLQPARPVRAS